LFKNAVEILSGKILQLLAACNTEILIEQEVLKAVTGPLRLAPSQGWPWEALINPTRLLPPISWFSESFYQVINIDF
jgi:hypothetical protein